MMETCQYARRWAALKNERSTWDAHWQDISRYLLPVNGRFFISDTNKGHKRFNDIYDNSAGTALNVLAAGMMSGMTSPSRPWFNLSLADRELMQYQPVKAWLNLVTEQIHDVFSKSNLYRVLHSMYEEMAAFGTAAALIGDDYNHIIHMHPFTIGEYAIGADWKGDVDTLYRQFSSTVGAVVKEFGYDNCSPHTKSLYDGRNYDARVTLYHAIQPRHDRNPALPDNKNMPFVSVYWEEGGQGKYLRESGFKSFPCVCPRWKTVGLDVYGISPAMGALGDIKGLQAQEFRKQQAIDYQVNPPLQVPSSMRNREMDIFPGGISYYDSQNANGGIKTAFEVNLNLTHLQGSQIDTRRRIDDAFFKNIFLMIAGNPADGRMTATEVIARNEEKMLMLGPVLERMNNELLDPLVESVFQKLVAGNLLPRPPDELQGSGLNIEYTSMLAQAQKAISVNGIDRFVSNLGQIATLKPDVLDNFNADHWADAYADKLGIDPQLILANDKVAIIRQQRAEAQKAQQQQEILRQAAGSVKDLGSISTQPGTAAGDFLNGIRQGQA